MAPEIITHGVQELNSDPEKVPPFRTRWTGPVLGRIGNMAPGHQVSPRIPNRRRRNGHRGAGRRRRFMRGTETALQKSMETGRSLSTHFGGLGALVALLVLAPAPVTAAETVTVWATADGAGSTTFQDHHLGRDSAAGPNGLYATGRWTGGERRGSYGGFGLLLPPGEPVEVEVLLAYHLTAPLTTNRLEITLETPSSSAGPVVLGAEELSVHVGAANTGILAVDLAALQTFTRAELEGGPFVDLYCRRNGPDDGADLRVDAVGLRVTVAAVGPFDLQAGDDAAVTRELPPLFLDVSSPATLASADCPEPICYLNVQDAGGAGVEISVVLMPDGETIRVGFEDRRPDAPVDPALSGVAAPEAIPADGATLAVVEIEVRDQDGWPLGGGVEMDVDPAWLGPAAVVGEFFHVGDGTYRLQLQSHLPGEATVVIEAEGVVLLDAPTVLFQSP
jgi:hypothetical protein